MGVSTKKSKTTTNQNTTMNTTPTNPEWVTTGIQGLAGDIGKTFDGIDPKTLVGGANPLQTLAGNTASHFENPASFGQAQNFLTSASGAGPQKVVGADASSYIGRFKDAGLKDYLEASLGDYDFGAGQTRAQNKLALAGDTTFGGSSGALQTSLSEDMLNRGRGKLSADIRQHAFDTALGAALQQAQMDNGVGATNAGLAETALSRQLNGGNALTALGSAQGANERANTGLQYDIGSGLRDVQNQQNASPITALMGKIAAYGGLPLDLFKGSNATGTLNGTTKTKSSGASLGEWLEFFKANAQAAAGGGG
jgi:hypothetical protein